jgi:hypothetical protein
MNTDKNGSNTTFGTKCLFFYSQMIVYFQESKLKYIPHHKDMK